MAEGVVDGGQRVDAGHRSGRLGQSAKRRPDGIPGDWIFDRRDKEWRPPRRPGPKPREADGGPDPDRPDGEDAGPGGSGWQADRDPAAAHLGAGDGKPDPPRVEASDDVKNDVAALLTMLAIPVSLLAERADPYCGGALAQQAVPIVEAATPIVCRSERVVRLMTAEVGGLMDWLGLAKALAPVAAAVTRHHILKNVEVVTGEENDQEQEPVRTYPAAA